MDGEQREAVEISAVQQYRLDLQVGGATCIVCEDLHYNTLHSREESEAQQRQQHTLVLLAGEHKSKKRPLG